MSGQNHTYFECHGGTDDKTCPTYMSSLISGSHNRARIDGIHETSHTTHTTHHRSCSLHKPAINAPSIIILQSEPDNKDGGY